MLHHWKLAVHPRLSGFPRPLRFVLRFAPLEQTMAEESSAWLTVRIGDTEGIGVDSRLLSRLLIEFSDSMLAAARFALGDRRSRRGPATESESNLAGLKITTVSPGSLVLDYERPIGLPVLAARLPGLESRRDVDPDVVANLVLDATEATKAGEDVAPGHEAVRRSVRRFLTTAAKIGASCDLDLRPPITSRRHVGVRLKDLLADTPIALSERQVSLYGHVYMADVELGRQRLRIKLPSDLDVTMEIAPDLRESLLALLDNPVELEVTETFAKGFIVNRTVRAARVLPQDLSGPERPPKSLVDLAAAQGLLNEPPAEYGALASAVWERKADVDLAESVFRQLRMSNA